MEVWTQLKEQIKNSWKEGKVVVYKSVSAPQKDYHQEQLLTILSEIGVNTLGANQPKKTSTTYEEVIEEIKKFRVKWIKVKESEQLIKIRGLVMEGEIEELKKLVKKGEI